VKHVIRVTFYPCLIRNSLVVAAWTWLFHTLTLARIDPDFAKRQLAVVPGNIYTPTDKFRLWVEFLRCKPPVHAWQPDSTRQKSNGGVGRSFLERIFHKILNFFFTWWLTKKDEDVRPLCGGFWTWYNSWRFLTEMHRFQQLQQADATGWMVRHRWILHFCEIAIERPSYQDMASKFLSTSLHCRGSRLDEGFKFWDQEDQFITIKSILRRAIHFLWKIAPLVV
jgi:hypothetical protein